MLNTLLATSGQFSLNWWMAVLTIISSAGAIFFFLKKILIKTILLDIKDINYKVSPNGKDTQNIGDITARSEDAIKELKEILGIIRVENMQTKEILIEHIGWHKGRMDSE